MPVPYLTFDGNAAEALGFYTEVLGGEEIYRQCFGDSPMKEDIPEEFHERMMHISIRLPSGTLMASDAGPWSPYEGSVRSCGLSLPFEAKDLETARKVFQALSEGGTVKMPFENTFWAKGFGMLVDRYGVSWMINCG